MTMIKQYEILLAIIPFALVLLVGYFLNCFPKRSAIVQMLDSLAEEDMRKLMDRAGLMNTSTTFYLLLRIIFATVTSVIMYFIIEGDIKAKIIGCVICFIVMYKLLYYFLVFKEKERIHKLNQLLPYTMKSISYLCYLYPLTNAFERSVNYIPDEFKDDIVQLVKDIDDDPISFVPYQKWIDRYEGKLNMLESYLHNLYRMGSSTSREQSKLLENLSSSISAETQRSRKNRNDSTNSSISYLGMLPVGYLTIMMVMMLMIVASAI